MRNLPLAVLVAAFATGTVSAQEEPARDYGALVKELGADGFEARSKAYEALEEAGAPARKALEEGTKSEDAQVRWSAKRLLRRLDGEDRKPLRVLRFDGEELPELPDVSKALEEARRRLGEIELPFSLGFEEDGARVERHVVAEKDGERIDARVDADGKVSVKVARTGADGKRAEESFEAKDMETLAREHPEVAKKVDPWLGGGGFRRILMPGFVRVKPALGVTVSDVPAVLRTQHSLPEGEGVVVEEVLPDTPAARMGLRHHDVILAVNGKPVADAASVRAAVTAVKEGGDLKLRILRGGKVEEAAGTR